MNPVFGLDDVRRTDVHALIAEHLSDMHATSPPESVHALDLDALAAEDIDFWTARDTDGHLLGCGALKRLSPVDAELKSMRTTRAARGLGIGRGLLQHLVATARAAGYEGLWLETGVEDYFHPARTLYAAHGFVGCSPFADYALDPNSVFMHLDLRT